MRGKLLLCGIVLLQLMQGIPASSVDPFDLADEILADETDDINYRLPKNVVPESYAVKISKIDFNEAQFTGETEIVFKTSTDLSAIHIHVYKLEGTNDTTKVTLQKVNEEDPTPIPAIQRIVPVETYQMLIIELSAELPENTLWKLTFKDYVGRMDHGMSGFYRSSYKENGTDVWMGTTQMQTVHARKVFPCFDEPSFKATFQISIERPTEYGQSFSNMPGEMETIDDKPWDVFEKTPIMSTYLVAFIVSKYAIIHNNVSDSHIFRVIARQSAGDQGLHAFNEGQGLVNAMGAYINLPYYTMGNKKMDQAAIPDFSAGAMENWGLITYREAYLLAKEGETNIRYKQFITSILAHEIAHMWFGNYLTCHWWSDTWLNEGFATLFEYKMGDLDNATIDYQFERQFPVVVVHRALLADTTVRSAPLTNNHVNSPAEISAHFSAISYSKGGSVLRMVEHYLGREVFRDGLRYYLANNKNAVVQPSNLYQALEATAPGKGITALMNSWVSQSGYPVVHAYIDYGNKTVNLTQKRMKKAWESDVKTLYQIPLTFATRTLSNFENTTTDLLLTTEEHVMNIPLNGHEWVVFNKKQIGFYRVNYDDHSWMMLRAVLVGNNRTTIHELNRAQIVDDLFNLARENILHYNITLDVLEFLQNETEYGPWQSAIPGFNFIRQQLSINEGLRDKLEAHIRMLVANVVKDLDVTADSGDGLKQLFRLNIMNFACSLDVTACTDYSVKTYETFMGAGTSVPANHREFVYCTALRKGNETHYDKLWEKYKTENVVNEQVVILGALGCTRNSTRISSLLDEISKPVNSLIRDQDVTSTLTGVLMGNWENTDIVLEYMEKDFAKLRGRLGSYSALFNMLGSRLTGQQINRFHLLITENLQILSTSEVSAGLTAYTNLLHQSQYVLEVQDVIETWLTDDKDGSAAAISSSIMLICAGVLLHLFNYKY